MAEKDRESERRFPEEVQPAGHDAELTPAPEAKDLGVRRGAAPAEAGSTPASTPPRPAAPDAVDAAFLVKGFGIPPGKASRLVRPNSSESASATEDEARQLLAQDDPLKDVPTPKEPATELTADTDEERLKPVLNRPNRASNL